jgi:hypothetical protein
VHQAASRSCWSAGLDPREWTPRELRHSFVSLLSDADVPIEHTSRLVGHSSTTTTETIYRKQIRLAIIHGADVMDRVFPGQADQGALVTQHRPRAGPLGIRCLLGWSEWPDLNRRPLRPEPRKRSNNRPDEGRIRWSERCVGSS